MVGRLNIALMDKPNTLGALTTIIGKNNGNIINIKIVNRDADLFEILLDIEVRDTSHLVDIIASLRSHRVVHSVERAKSR